MVTVFIFFPSLTLTIHYRQQTKPILHPPPYNMYTHTHTHPHTCMCPVILPLAQRRSQNPAWPSVSVDTLSFQTVPALLWLNLLTFLIPTPWLKFLLHFSNPTQEWGASDNSLSLQSCFFFLFFFCLLPLRCLVPSGKFFKTNTTSPVLSLLLFPFGFPLYISLYFYDSVI